jgi:putative endonuclease
MTNNRNTVLYTGVTNNLKRRALEHKNGEGGGFTKRYNVVKLVYFEVGDDINKAIFREKQIKSWNRGRKEEIVNAFNSEWKDLYDEI